MDYELMHHGVKGMKWGVRRAKKDARNKNYSSAQRKIDKALYGEKGVKRINKKMNKGHGVQSARHYEVARKERKEKARKGLKRTANVLSTIGTAYIYDKAFNDGRGTRVVKDVVKTTGRLAVNAIMKAQGATSIRWYD